MLESNCSPKDCWLTKGNSFNRSPQPCPLYKKGPADFVQTLEDFKQEQDSYRTGCRTFYNEKVETIVSSQLSKLVKTLTEDQTMREEEDLESSQRG